MDGDLEGCVVAEGVAVDGEGDVPGGRGEWGFSGAEEDGFVFGIVLLEEEAEVVVFHGDVGAGGEEVGGDEDGLGVSVSEGLEEFVGFEEVEGEFGEGDFGIVVEAWDAVFRRGVLEDEF